jgi:hypothetical protein
MRDGKIAKEIGIEGPLRSLRRARSIAQGLDIDGLAGLDAGDEVALEQQRLAS